MSFKSLQFISGMMISFQASIVRADVKFDRPQSGVNLTA
jgi:hypothetical protein